MVQKARCSNWSRFRLFDIIETIYMKAVIYLQVALKSQLMLNKKVYIKKENCTIKIQTNNAFDGVVKTRYVRGYKHNKGIQK